MAKTRIRRKNRLNPEAIFESALKFILRNLYLAVIIVVLFLIANGVYTIALNSDYFIIKDIEPRRIEGNSTIIDTSVKFKAQKSINIFRLDLKKYQQEVEGEHPEIKDIRINRVLPDKLVIYFQKRKPVCQVKSGLYYLVSNDAVILPNPKIYPQPGLLVISGISIDARRLKASKSITSASMQKALQLIQEIEQTGFDRKYKIAEIDVHDDSNPVIVLEYGTNIILGKQSFKDKEAALMQVLDDIKSKQLRPRSVDLRFDDVVVTP